MKEATKRLIVRWIHIVLAIPILGYIYSPFDQIPNYASVTRYVYVPILVLSGLWMWKGHVVRRLLTSRPVAGTASHSNLRSSTGG
jgi:thiosulfate reductase cytochrome b subunit